MARCRTCQQEIVWGRTESGKRVPLDPPEKRFVMKHTPDAEQLYVRMIPTYISHFATCPQADEHRKPIPGSTEDYLKEDKHG
jgi:hypothetical protein